MLEFPIIGVTLKQDASALSKLEKQSFKKKILEKSFVMFYRSHNDEVRKKEASIKELREP